MKTVLVTGASSGIGKEAARKFAEGGYRVYAAARRVDRMQDLAGLGAVPLKMDITVDAEVTSAVNCIREEAGGIDILVNNAGFALYGAVEDTPLQQARYQFDVNVFGLARLTQLVIPDMRTRGHGKIVNISSVGGKIYTPLGSWYHATKHAVEGWSDCLRLELAPFGIDVILVEPGMIDTEFTGVVKSRLPETHGESPYRALIEAMLKGAEARGETSGSPPSVVADVILKAVESPRPRTRYAAGSMARMLLAMRRWFSDRFFDRTIMKAFT